VLNSLINGPLLLLLPPLLLLAAEGEDPLGVVEHVMSRELKPELDMSMLAAMAPTMAFV
jgi:hypothetical protein